MVNRNGEKEGKASLPPSLTRLKSGAEGKEAQSAGAMGKERTIEFRGGKKRVWWVS